MFCDNFLKPKGVFEKMDSSVVSALCVTGLSDDLDWIVQRTSGEKEGGWVPDNQQWNGNTEKPECGFVVCVHESVVKIFVTQKSNRKAIKLVSLKKLKELNPDTFVSPIIKAPKKILHQLLVDAINDGLLELGESVPEESKDAPIQSEKLLNGAVSRTLQSVGRN